MTILDKTALKAALDADVDANGVQGITGAKLNAVLTNFIDSLSSSLSSRFSSTQEGNGANTVINTIGVYEPANVSLIPGASNVDFTVSGGVVTYTGALTKNFIIDSKLSILKVGGAAVDLLVKPFKNGTTAQPITMSTAVLPGFTVLQGISGVVSLSTGDTLEIKIANGDTTDDVLIENMAILVNEWF